MKSNTKIANYDNLIQSLLQCRLQRLLPLKRALTELEHDIRDAHNAMEQVSCSILDLVEISWM